MRRVTVMAAMVVLTAVRAAEAQPLVRTTLAQAVQAHIRTETFQPVTAVRGLPLGVREELERMFGVSASAIAEPGARFQATDVISEPGLPIRRLNVAGCSQDHCLVYYERGGIAHTWQALLFRWTPDRTTVEAGGSAPALLRSVEDLRTLFLSGGLSPSKNW